MIIPRVTEYLKNELTIRAEWIVLSTMIGPKFLSPEDRRELLACVKRQREGRGIARRANALLLLEDGKSRAEIAGVLYLDNDTRCAAGASSTWPRAGTLWPMMAGRAGSPG